MNTATATRFKTAQNTVVRDSRRVIGYSGGVPHLTMAPKASGLDCNPITGGKILLFVPGQHNYRGMFNTMQGKYPMQSLQIMPSEYAKAVEMKFQITEDFGYRTLNPLTSLSYSITGTEYYDEAEEYFNLLHPQIECEFGLEQNVRMMNDSSDYIACPTCRLKELRSQECVARIESSPYDKSILYQTRDIMIDACETALRVTSQKVTELEDDMKRRLSGQNGRATRNEVDYIHLKMLHRNPPVEDTASGMHQMTQAITQAFQHGATQTAQSEQEDVEKLKLKLRIAELEAEKANRTAPVSAPVEAVVETPVIQQPPVSDLPIIQLCTAIKKNGESCTMKAVNNTMFCQFHVKE